MKERFRQNQSESIYYDPFLDLTHIFETVIKPDDYQSLFCNIEKESAGYHGDFWCFLYGKVNKKIDDKERFQIDIAQTLHTLILEAMPHYLDEDLAKRKEALKHEMIKNLEKIPSKKETEKHWHKFVPDDMKTTMSMSEWLKDRQENKVNMMKKNKEIIIISKNRETNLRQEILDEKFTVIAEANSVEFRFRLNGLGDPLYHSFIKFLDRHQIKGTGLVPGGWFDAHRPGTPNNWTPTERSEEVYRLFLQQTGLYERALKAWREAKTKN